MRRAVRIQKLSNCKKISLTDNLVCLSALEKGRSHSFALNRICQQSAGCQLATGIRWKCRHVETMRNIADSDSRKFEGRRHAFAPFTSPWASGASVHLGDSRKIQKDASLMKAVSSDFLAKHSPTSNHHSALKLATKSFFPCPMSFPFLLSLGKARNQNSCWSFLQGLLF